MTVTYHFTPSLHAAIQAELDTLPAMVSYFDGPSLIFDDDEEAMVWRMSSDFAADVKSVRGGSLKAALQASLEAVPPPSA